MIVNENGQGNKPAKKPEPKVEAPAKKDKKDAK